MTEMQMLILELAGKQYSCAQMVMIGGLRLMGRENTDLVRAMAGLAQGVGGSGSACGALAGGACLLALHTGKGHDDEEAEEQALLLQEELFSWFTEECCHGGPTTCDSILEVNVTGERRSLRPGRCGSLVERVWEKSIQLLVAHGFDPTLGK